MAESTTTPAKMDSLKNKLTAALPDGFKCRVRYVHTAPKRCDPLFSPPPGHDPEVTRLASHLLMVSIAPPSSAGVDKGADVFVFAVEALVYSTKHLTTIFVSKADSTGHLPQQKPSPVKTVTTTFLQWLAAKELQKHSTRKVVISLFARSQSQYLFPGSAENGKKHVLDDRQLIKWWARVLDPIFPKSDEQSKSTDAETVEYNGYITVPGYEGSEIRPFMPPQNSSSASRWHPGNPLVELAETRRISKDLPPRCLLPRFPDDPKARFMQDLDDEAGLSEEARVTISPSKRKNGKWRSIDDLNRFWEAMEFRQECSSGRVVGFLWLVIGPRSSKQNGRDAKDEDQTKLLDSGSSQDTLGSDPASQNDSKTTNGRSPTKRRRKPLSGPIIPRQPRLKGGSSSLKASDLNHMLDTEPTDGVILSKEGYDSAMHRLLHLDFANLEAATQSTNKWTAEISGMADSKIDWSINITGTAHNGEAVKSASGNGNLHVNDLGGMVRKKRKAEDQAVSEGHAVAETRGETAREDLSTVNVLSTGLVRKKAKPVVG